ncbi:MAG: glycine cleavage system aminomethyltransferase GcvT, partial [Methylococcales bacterium]
MDQQLPHSLKKTPLHALHLKLGAAMMPFAGYEMPLQFASIKQEHLHTRQQAGLFDVSHMGLFRLSGPDAAGALERLVPADIKNLPLGKQRYTLLLNQDGGIVDDLMITHTYQGLLLVVNAGCKIKDRDFLNTHLQGDCRLDELNQFSLLAVQGPQAARVLSRYHPAIAALPFMTGKYFTLMNHECFSSRCGYCGEDGYELVIANDALENVAVKLLDNAEV